MTFNSKLDYMNTKTGVYQKTPGRAVLGRIRHSKDRRVIGIEVVKEHVFGDLNFNTIEIVLFKANISKQALQSKIGHSLHHVKALLSIERGVNFDFDFSDEITEFHIPYIFFMHQSFIKIVSPITSKSQI
jgi:hypothetical protein